jgi:SAM-dependent methyltransferase
MGLQRTLKNWIAEPRTRGLDLDDPRTTELRREIIRGKLLLRQIYEEWYTFLLDQLPPGKGAILEIGSGGGFLKGHLSEVITSDLFACTGIDALVDASVLPFPDQSLRGIVMVNVLHHLGHPRRFFREASRCVGPGGVVAMIEPWNTPWAALVWRWLHHEPFRPDASQWEFETTGPLTGANLANPWIILSRDRLKFEQEFPEWLVREIRPCLPLRYLLSGGVSTIGFVPGWTSDFWKRIEACASPLVRLAGLFARICLVRRVK